MNSNPTYFQVKTHNWKLSRKTELNTAISNSQKSKDQKVVHWEVLGEGLEDRERREDEGGRDQSFGFLINSV